jgi:hypothetical protein
MYYAMKSIPVPAWLHPTFNVFKVTDRPEGDVERRLSSPADREVDTTTKYNYALHRQLAERFNFTYVCGSFGKAPAIKSILN